VNANTGEAVSWHTPQMILPVSRSLRMRFDQMSSEPVFLQARASLSYELRPAT
jgi:hypothetical protein